MTNTKWRPLPRKLEPTNMKCCLFCEAFCRRTLVAGGRLDTTIHISSTLDYTIVLAIQNAMTSKWPQGPCVRSAPTFDAVDRLLYCLQVRFRYLCFVRLAHVATTWCKKLRLWGLVKVRKTGQLADKTRVRDINARQCRCARKHFAWIIDTWARGPRRRGVVNECGALSARRYYDIDDIIDDESKSFALATNLDEIVYR